MPTKSQKADSHEEKITYTNDNKVEQLEDALAAAKKTWKPTTEEDEAIKRIVNRYQNELYPAQSQFHTEWDDAKQIYEAFINIDPTGTRENFRVPVSHMMIEAAIAEEIDAFPDFELDTEDGEDRQKLPIMNAAKDYALYRTKWDRVKFEALRIRRVYGFCPVRIYFRRETRFIKERYPIKSDEGIMVGYKDVIDYPWDDICIEAIDNPKRFFIDNNCHDIDEAEDCILTTDLSWGAFRQKVQNDRRFKNIEFVKPGADYTVVNNGGQLKLVPPETTIPDYTKKVRILEYWNKYRDEYVMIAGGIIIRQTCLLDDHKELPFAIMHMHRRPHSFYSKGIPKLLESLEAAYNSIMNATIRATKLAFPILATEDDSAIDPRSISSYPGVVLEGAMNKIDLKQLGTVPAEAYQTKEKIEELFIQISGINYKQIFGEQSDRVGIEALKKESSLSRINANIRENEAGFVVRLGDLLMQDIMQYYPTPKVRKLMSTDNEVQLADKLVTDKAGKIIGVLQERKIPIKGLNIKEIENKQEGTFSLQVDGYDQNSYILARPEYIRTKSKLSIRSVRPSAMGSSKEAKKLTLTELMNTALQVNQANIDPATQAPSPIWDLDYLSQQIALANEISVKKAIISQETDKSRKGESTINELADQFNQTFKRQAAPGQPPTPAGLPNQPQQPNDTTMTNAQKDQFAGQLM